MPGLRIPKETEDDAVTKKHKIAVIPGDGIGKEVVPEGLKVLDAVATRFGIGFQWDHFDWSCDYYAKHGKMMPDDWQAQIGQHEAIFFGSIGWPATVPDHEALWGSLFKFRREFDQYINLRPVRLMPGVPSPLKDRQPGEIDFFIVRENTEGEYSAAAACSRAPSAKWSSRKASSPASAPTASSSSPSSWRRSAAST